MCNVQTIVLYHEDLISILHNVLALLAASMAVRYSSLWLLNSFVHGICVCQSTILHLVKAGL